MQKRLLIVAIVVLALCVGVVGHHAIRAGEQPVAIVLASIQSDTIDGLNGVDPIAPALSALGYKVYSIDLPCHFAGMEISGLACWRSRIGAGEVGLLSDFCAEVSALIDSTGASRVQMVGVSRGGYVAFQCGALDARVSEIAQIAPVVDLGSLREFADVSLDPDIFSLVKYTDVLRHKPTLIRISRYDHRVDTEMSVIFGALIGAEVQLLPYEGHRAPDPDNLMAKWLHEKWNRWL